MNPKIFWMLPATVAVALGLALGWQRLELRPLRAELEVQRDWQTEIRGLRAQRERLRAQQVPAAELELLRADRAAIARMRGEMAAVQTRSDEKTQELQARAAERFAAGQSMPAATWRKVGAASPAATLETVLWSAAGGDVDTFARLIHLEGSASKAAQDLLESLPPAEQARHASPAHLLAFLSIQDIPLGGARVLSWANSSAAVQSVSLSLSAAGEKSRAITLVFQRIGDEWRLRATEAAVHKYAAGLRGPPGAAGGK